MEKETLYRFFEGTAGTDELKAIQKWLDEAPENQTEFFKQRKVFDTMLLLPGVEEEHALEEKNEEENNNVERRSRSRILLTSVWKYAAVIIIAISATLAVLHYFNKEQQAVMLTASVPAGQRAEIMLPDSTMVWLNSGSVLKYPSSFTKDRRNIVLDGEGYFTVTKNPHKPFTVQTANGYVTVLGTVFNLKSYSAEPRMEASLVSGLVKAKGRTGEEVVLSPNQKMIWDNGKTTVIATNEDDYLWKKGILTFTDRPLSVILFQLGKTYNKDITIKKKSLGNIVLSGKFRISDGMDYALRVLQETYGFRYSTDSETGNIIIY